MGIISKPIEYEIYKECGLYSVYVGLERVGPPCVDLDSAKELAYSISREHGKICYDSKREFICGGEI